MSKISKLYQVEAYPKGDCFRTCIACILKKQSIHEVPNFMEDGEEYFWSAFRRWLDENDFEYIEAVVNEKGEHNFIHRLPVGTPCVMVGGSPRGEYQHAVVGEVTEEGFISIHDPATGWEGPHLRDIRSVGFLVRRL